MLNEVDILNQAKLGDQNAITQLVMHYQHMVRNYLYTLTPDPNAGDDLAQDVFVKFFRSLDRIDPNRGIKPYLMTITRNVAIDYWRQRGRFKETYDEVFIRDLEKWYQMEGDQHEPHMLTLKLEALKKCLKTLNERISRVIRSFYYQNLRCREIADHIGTNETNVRALLYRGRKALFKCIITRMRKLQSNK